jgi:TDG/mug DNA glycosylase family protein
VPDVAPARHHRRVERGTVDVYEHSVDAWIEHRRRPRPPALDRFAARVPPGVRADIGCGPGWHSGELGAPVVALDASAAMAARVREFSPAAWPAVGDLERLPFRAGSLTGAWAHKSYMHIPQERLPLALAELHRAMTPGGALHVQVTSDRNDRNADDRFPGRHFAWWPAARLRDVVEGAGFEVLSFVDDGKEWIDVEAMRARMLPDTVGDAMRLLVVGLNPSLFSAEAGVGFARPGNRFWPAAVASGVVTRSHDPFHALRADGVGMTNLVRRATRRAAELAPEEYTAGAARLERLVRWLRPRAVCFVGVGGYRAAIDRGARTGWQPRGFGGVPAYVMPNTSGLNAHAKPAEFAAHLRAATRPPA